MIDLFSCVQQTNDDGYIFGGTNSDFPPMDVSLTKTDTCGQVIWARTYGDGELSIPLTGSYFLNDVRQTNDGGYIFTGECYSDLLFGTDYDDLFLIKIDATGTIEWNRKYGKAGAETTPDGGYFVKQTSDNGYIVTGYTYSFGTKDSTNIFLLKINNSGGVTWDKTFQISTDDDDIGEAVVEVSDGYVVAGYTTQLQTSPNDTTYDIFLIKTDLNGNIQWAKTYGDDYDSEVAYDIEMATDGNLLITGFTNQNSSIENALLIKINPVNGNVVFANSYGLGLIGEGHSIQQTSDGGYAIFGMGMDFLGTYTALLKINSSYTPEFARWYGWFAMDIFARGQQTSDDEYVMGTIAAGGGGWDFALYKTDADGWSGCNEGEYTATQTACTYISEDITPAEFSGSYSETFTAYEGDVTPIDSIFCCSPHPIITITTVPDPATICEGESITLTADGGVDYEWSTGETTASIVVSPANTTTYTVTANADMCPGTESIVVTVVPIPIVDAGSNTSICENTSIDLTANCSNCSGSETYEWDTGETTQVITVSPIVQTTYTVTITNQGCSDLDSIIVSVMPAPTPSITGDTCANQTGAIYSTTNNPGNTYDWYIDTIGGTVIAGGQGTPSITVDWGNVGGGEVIVTEIDINSCIGIDTFFAYVNPVPLIIGDDTVCSNETVSYSTTNNFGNSYNWVITGENVASGQGTSDITITWGTDSTGIVRVFETTGGVGCTGVDSISVFIKPSPTADAGSDITICIDSSTILTASATGGISPYTYEWDGGETDSSITVTPATETTYIITVTGDNQCTDTDDVVVTVNDPQADAGTDQIVCLGDSTILTATGAGPGGTYIWNTTETTASITVSPVNATTYTVTVADAIGCIDVDSVVITMGIQPVADFSADPLIIISYSNVQFTDNSQNAIYWEWDFGDDSNDTVQNPLHTYTSDGIYTVTLIVTSVDGCKDTLIKTEYIHVNAADIFIPSGFTPDDNGVNNIFSVRGAKTWDMEIYNQWGLMIYEGIDLKYPQGWDGTYKDEDQPVGNYVYIITATSMDDTEITEKGVVTLIR